MSAEQSGGQASSSGRLERYLDLSLGLVGQALDAYMDSDFASSAGYIATHERIKYGFDSPVISTLRVNERQTYKHVIHTFGDTEVDLFKAQAVVVAMNEAGLDVVTDIDPGSPDGIAPEQRLIIRSSNPDAYERGGEKALFSGVSLALELDSQHGGDELYEYASPLDKARHMVHQITDDRLLHLAFKESFAGVDPCLESGILPQVIFDNTAEYDKKLVEANLSSGYLHTINRSLGYPVDFSLTEGWLNQAPQTILERHPGLDYRKLDNPTFAASPEGRALKEAYRLMTGMLLGDAYRNFPIVEIDDSGRVVPRPIVPLSRVPVIEALLVNKINALGSGQEYFSGVVTLALNSDSSLAQAALVQAAIKRAPLLSGERSDEIEQADFFNKTNLVKDMLAEFRRTTDPSRQEVFKQYLLDIFAAYTGNGEIAQSVRAEHLAAQYGGFSLSHVDTVKDIVKDMLTVGITSPYAKEFIDMYFRSDSVSDDPLRLNLAEGKLLIIDAVDQLDSSPIPRAFLRLIHKYFGEDSIDIAMLNALTGYKSTYRDLLSQPHILLAHRQVQVIRNLDGASESDIEAAITLRDRAMAPGHATYRVYRRLYNDLLLGQLDELSRSDKLAALEPETIQLFDGLVERIKLVPDSETGALPDEYYRLMNLCLNYDLPAAQKARIFNKVVTEFKNDTSQVINVLLDMYQAAFGALPEMKTPDEHTAMLLEAAHSIVDGRAAIFRYADDVALDVFADYHERLLQSAKDQLDSLIPFSSEGQSSIENDLDKARRLKRVRTQIQNFEHLYVQYLEDKKT